MLVQTRIVGQFICGQGNRNGMIRHVMPVFLTFVKSMVSTTSVMNIYTIDGLKLVLSPGGAQQMFIRGGSVPDFSRKSYPFRILSIDKSYIFTSV